MLYTALLIEVLKVEVDADDVTLYREVCWLTLILG